MKFTQLAIYLILFVPIFSFSQSKYAEEAKEFFWGAEDKHKNSNTIPDKWKNESAVIIFKNENYDFHKFGKNVTYKNSFRQRIKLLDIAAVEEFSEFHFKQRFSSNKGYATFWKKGKNEIGVKVIKPDGKQTIIDVYKEAVEVDGQHKLAIPNLEVGDIIDYYFYQVEPFKTPYAFGFDPVEKTLGEEYPIMEYKLFFETENDFFINFNSYNGAPKLKEIPLGKFSKRRYVLEEKDIEKINNPIWSYPLTNFPAYKFQVYFARSGKFEDAALAFLPEKESIIKKTVSKEEVLNLYDSRFTVKSSNKYVPKSYKREDYKSEEEFVSAVYYYMRHAYFNKFLEAFIASESKIEPTALYKYSSAFFIQDQKAFIRTFTTFLKSEKIDYEIVVAKKRYDGTLNDLLIEKNVEVLIKVLTPKPLYVSHFSQHTTINQKSPFIEGTDVYLLSSSKRKIDQIKKGKMPVSHYQDNEKITTLNLSIQENFSGFKVNLEDKTKGHLKTTPQDDRLYITDFVYKEYKKYETTPYLEYYPKKKRAQLKDKLDAIAVKINDKQKEQFQENLKEEFDVEKIEDYDFKITENGRYGFHEYFVYEEDFTIKDAFIKKAGPNYIIEIGKFIGSQINVEVDDRERTENINMPYPRTIKNTINLKIPEGYTISGLDKLQTEVENETGGFKSTATVENQTLSILTTKIYKNNTEPSSNWSKMLKFLDLAQEFKNKKILLKKSYTK